MADGSGKPVEDRFGVGMDVGMRVNVLFRPCTLIFFDIHPRGSPSSKRCFFKKRGLPKRSLFLF
jgi:hypothetical protein